jgi:cob(I)alamin adenosyltransferase
LGTYILLAEYLNRENLKKIFGKNLEEDQSLFGLLKELLGLFGEKPYDCVATRNEMCCAITNLNKDLVATQREILYKAQRDLFVIGSNIAGAQIPLSSLPSLREKDIEILENAIDEMQKLLPELKNFILPGGSEIAALCFVARAVCRRGERAVTSLKEKYPKFDILVQKYLNRLSDYLFVLARFLNMVDVVAEQVWRSA